MKSLLGHSTPTENFIELRSSESETSTAHHPGTFLQCTGAESVIPMASRGLRTGRPVQLAKELEKIFTGARNLRPE